MTIEQLPIDPLIYHHRIRNRLLLTAAGVVSYALFVGTSHLFSIPTHPEYSAALIQQPWPPVVFLVTAIVFVACVVISSLITNIVHYDAGFFCACIGLSALSIRGGPIRYTLMAAAGPSIFLGLALELIILYAILFVGWLALGMLCANNLVTPEHERVPPTIDEEDVPSQGPLAMASQIMLMIFLMSVLCQTDRKVQVLAAVGISAFLATLGAQSIFPTRPSTWFWFGPLILGLLGYLFAYYGDGLWTTGVIYGYDPALARPLPLDYAAAGPVGALLGYWTCRRWQALHELQPAPDENAQTAGG